MAFSDQDHADLAAAADLVKTVADRHHTADLRAISALCSALQDIRLAERYADNPAKPKPVVTLSTDCTCGHVNNWHNQPDGPCSLKVCGCLAFVAA